MNESWSSVCRRDRLVWRSLWVATAVVLIVVVTVHCCLGADRSAVVKVGGCSGVCVDPAGLVLTAKHCRLGETETVAFYDRTVSARRVYVPPETEGPVVYACDGADFPWAAVAPSVPPPGSSVVSMGFPAVPGGREFRRAEGTLLSGGRFTFEGGPFLGNVTDIVAAPGWSGGPLFNSGGEVIGLLNSGDHASSIFISHAAVRAAYDVARALTDRAGGRPRLYVFTTPLCPPCLAFKADYRLDAQFRQRLQDNFDVVLVDASERPALAREHGVTEVPAFVVAGKRPLFGYPGKTRLVAALLERIEERVAPDGPSGRDPPDAGRNDTERLIANLIEDLQALRDQATKTRADFEDFKESGVVGKIRAVARLKSDKDEALERVEAVRADVEAIRARFREKPFQFLWGLAGILSGLVHRRFAN